MDVNTNPISGNQTPTAATTAAASSNSIISSDFETFLQMLTAQAKYQDPLEPLDSGEYAAQLAQFSTVEQQVKTNELLESMTGQLGTSNLAQFAGWIGMEGKTIAPTYFDGEPISVAPVAAEGAQEMSLVVRDANNAEVDRIRLSLDTTSFEWTGVNDDGSTVPAGVYSFVVESRSEGQVIDTNQVASYSRITETRVEDGLPVLVLESGSVVDPNSVSALRES